MVMTMTKAKLQATDLAKSIRKLATDDGVVIGRILGEASVAKAKADAQGRVFDELGGKFKGVPATPYEVSDGDEKVMVEAIISNRALLPLDVHELVVAELRKGGVAAVQFALDVSVKKAKNPAGYVFECKPLFPISGADSDPLAAVNARLVKADTADETDTSTEKGKKAA